ncbi:Non-histone chromosomal protein 6 [Mayamaea pseudoterrestris]|nr:Non-histone chromosomal protein 6 [Mayamaea pseudoterrestris]
MSDSNDDANGELPISSQPAHYEEWRGGGQTDERYHLERDESTAFRPAHDSAQVGSIKEQDADNAIPPPQILSTTDAPPWLSNNTSTRRRKKPRGMPKRPLSAYNIFFQTQRPIVLSSADNHVDGKGVGFANLARIIGAQWKEIDDVERAKYDQLADEDTARYRLEMDAYHDWKRKQNLYQHDDNMQQLAPPDDPVTKNHQNFLILDYDEPPPVTNSRLASFLTSPLHARLPDSEAQSSVYNVFDHSSHHFDSQHSYQSAWYRRDYSNGAAATGRRIAPLSVDALPIPQGVTITLPDHTGVERLYTVDYRLYVMTRREAREYMQRLRDIPRLGVPEIEPRAPWDAVIPRRF